MTARTRDAELPTPFAPAQAPSERLLTAVRFAQHAPSGHNTQPWRWHIDGNRLELHADRSRGLPVVDPDDRELVVSCGAALYTARLTLAAHGQGCRVDVLPHGEDSDVLAVLTLVDTPPAVSDAVELFGAVQRRATGRLPYDDERLEPSLIDALRRAATAEGAVLAVVPAPARDLVCDLIEAGDRRQMHDRAFRHELADWMRPTGSRRPDGIPATALGLSAAVGAVAPMVVRTFDVGSSHAARSRELAAAAPLLAAIVTAEDGAVDWLRAGQGLQHVLLRATVAGASASFFNQPVELPDLRRRLRVGLGVPGEPQVLLRFGYGPPALPTPRRPVDDVLL